MIVALYHVSVETLGLIRPALDRRRLPVRAVHLYAGEPVPAPDRIDGLIIMGGPMNVDDDQRYPYLLAERRLIESCLRRGTPILGICLGAQIIARALGARVSADAGREVGWKPIVPTAAGAQDPVFSALGDCPTVLHWHGDRFDIPVGAERLAASALCDNQAFRFGENVYGLQFHLETTDDMIASWIAAPGGASYVRGAGEDPGALLAESSARAAALRPVAESFFESYVERAFGPAHVR